MPITLTESGAESFTLDAAHPTFVDTQHSLVLTAESTINLFTSAQFPGVSIWAVDAANAQLLASGATFTGTLLNPNGQFGLTTGTLGAGTWFFGATDSQLGATPSTMGFIDASVVSLNGGTSEGNVPLAAFGNPGAWRAVAFNVVNQPQVFLEGEANGGHFVVMTDAQFQTFSTTFHNGFNGGDIASVGPVGVVGTEVHAALTLGPGAYDLVWINDTGGWAGGAANLTFFRDDPAGASGSGLPTGVGTVVGTGLPSSDADTLIANPNFAEIHAGLGNDTIIGASVSDYLRGDEGDDSISGGAQFDDINGNMGNDTLHGNAGDDWVVGGKDNDVQFGDAGDDIVWGNLGNDTLDGGDGNDQVRGGQGDDVLNGGAGNDFVSGDRGNDTITGGAGADIFHGSQDAGIDRVMDFNLAEGDRVMLDPGTTFTVKQVGADTVIDMGASASGAPNEMILVGVQMSTLTGNWIFGF